MSFSPLVPLRMVAPQPSVIASITNGNGTNNGRAGGRVVVGSQAILEFAEANGHQDLIDLVGRLYPMRVQLADALKERLEALTAGDVEKGEKASVILKAVGIPHNRLLREIYELARQKGFTG